MPATLVRCRLLCVTFLALLVAGVPSSAAAQVTIDGDTPWVVFEQDYKNPAIRAAIRNAERDWYKVFGYPPVVFKNNTRRSWTGPVVVFGSAEASGQLIRTGSPSGAEQHRVFLGKARHNEAVISVGADTRGTVFAIYTFCEEVLGIDPMYVFTDSVAKKRKSITLASGFEIAPRAPTFKYRGWFINDEELHDGMHRDPLGGNVISMEWMDKILETLLRCKGNMIIPESAPYPDATVYELCKRREVAVTHHHVTPLGLNMMDWPEGVPFSYMTHRDILVDAWTKAVKAQAEQEIVWIIGFRGESDGAFWNSDPAAPKTDAERAAVIADAMQTQVDIVRAQDPDGTIVAALWNEQGAFYNRGLLKIPDGVCKMFADDGRGFMRDKGDGSDLSPGDGLYYHVMMMMLTQNRTTEAVPPARFYKELKRYVDRGATEYAIINVSGIRPAAMSVEAITDFLWDAEPALGKDPGVAMREYLVDWYGRQFGEELAEPLADLRLHYYDIPYMRDTPPVQGRWQGARAEHLLQYQIQELLKRYGDLIVEGKDPAGEDQFANRFRQAKEPLAETAEFFPKLWEETVQMEARVPEDRKDFYRAHFKYQVAVHLHSARALQIVCDAFDAYQEKANPRLFTASLGDALVEVEQIIDQAHTAEYGKWDTMFMHVRLMDIYRTRLLMKQLIARVEGEPFTDVYRGYHHGSFWKSAQEYMDEAPGTFPYFHRHSGAGLEVLEAAPE